MRWAARVDETQDAIVKALRYAGVQCIYIKLPCDLACYFRNAHFLIDCDGITKNRKRSKKQLETFARMGVRIAKTPLEALRIVGAVNC